MTPQPLPVPCGQQRRRPGIRPIPVSWLWKWSPESKLVKLKWHWSSLIKCFWVKQIKSNQCRDAEPLLFYNPQNSKEYFSLSELKKLWERPSICFHGTITTSSLQVKSRSLKAYSLIQKEAFPLDVFLFFLAGSWRGRKNVGWFVFWPQAMRCRLFILKRQKRWSSGIIRSCTKSQYTLSAKSFMQCSKSSSCF